MNNKETIIKIEEMMQSGMSRGAIFTTLGPSDDLARLVVSVPTLEDRKQYAKINAILFVILIYVSIAKIVFPVINAISMNLPLIALPFALFWPLIVGYFAVNIRKYRGTSYIPAGFICIALFSSSASALIKLRMTSEIISWALFNLPLLIGAYLSFYLKNKLCPFLGFWGAKSDSQGKYKFNAEG